jgi:DNA adenine methylase
MKPPFPYWGGKQKMVQHILPLIPPHDGYIEPFFGGGAVFFSKESAKYSIINDKLDYLVIAYRAIANNAEDVAKLLKSIHPRSRFEFNRLKAIKDNPLQNDPVDVAVATIYCHYHSMFAKGNDWSTKWNNRSIVRMQVDQLLEIQKKLSANVTIENTCAIKVVEGAGKYESNFIYIDPPYLDREHGPYAAFSKDDYSRLIEACKQSKAKIMISEYWNEYLVELSKTPGWHVKEIVKTYDAMTGVNGTNCGKITEVLLMNYK